MVVICYGYGESQFWEYCAFCCKTVHDFQNTAIAACPFSLTFSSGLTHERQVLEGDGPYVVVMAGQKLAKGWARWATQNMTFRAHQLPQLSSLRTIDGNRLDPSKGTTWATASLSDTCLANAVSSFRLTAITEGPRA